MNSSQRKTKQALIEVRKAYRLLHDYQRAALDAANYIGAELGFTYYGGYPHFSDCSPREEKGKLDNWAWDWLNLVFYEFYFTPKIKKRKDVGFSIWLFSDTGYFVSDNPAVNQTEISTFAEVDVSATKVAFLFYYEWEKRHDEFRDNRDAIRRFLEAGELPAALKNDAILAKCYDFSRLADIQSTDEVIDELIRLDVSKKFHLERVKKLA